MRRLTTPAGVVELVLFLASLSATDIPGQTYAVDGGHMLG